MELSTCLLEPVMLERAAPATATGVPSSWSGDTCGQLVRAANNDELDWFDVDKGEGEGEAELADAIIVAAAVAANNANADNQEII